MNKPAEMFATTFLFICLVFLCANPAYCEVNKTAEALTARIKALLELEGKPFFDERDKFIEEWSADVQMLEELRGQLPTIAKAVAEGLIARIKYPDLMKEFDEKHYKALCTIADPPVIYKNMMGERFPPPYPRSFYMIENTPSWEGSLESLKIMKDLRAANEYKEYYLSTTLPNNIITLPFMSELLAYGTRFKINNDVLRRMYDQYGDIARRHAVSSILAFKQWNDPELSDLLYAVCNETNALDSLHFFALITKYVLTRGNKKYYYLLAQEKYQEMVRKTKILGDPDSKIPPLPKDALYYRYFEEIVKYVEENPKPTPTPIPTLVPSTAPTQKPVQAEPQDKAVEVQNGSAWFLILAASIAAVIVIAVVILLRRRKTH